MNNNSRHHKGEHSEFYVNKVGRKYINLRRVHDGEVYGMEVNYCPITGSTQEAINTGFGGNGGWMFFKTRQQLFEYQIRTARDNTLKREFRDAPYCGLPEWLTEDLKTALMLAYNDSKAQEAP